MAERKPITKSLRFKIFKRDKFICQYCGNSAPTVILEVDHIIPVKENGTNEDLNLVTSCFDCNRGKGAKTLDNSAIIKTQNQELQKLALEQEQTEFLMKWKKELLKLQTRQLDLFEEELHHLTKNKLSDYGKELTLKLIRKFSFIELMDALQISVDKYFHDKDDFENMFNKLSGIMNNKRFQKENPVQAKIHHIKLILKGNVSYYDDREALKILNASYGDGISLNDLEIIAKTSKSWNKFIDSIVEIRGL